MTTEDAFLRAILANPAEDTPRLVYADWLDEQEDAVSQQKAAFLRATAQLTKAGRSEMQQTARQEELHKLAAGLESDWLAVVSKLKVENCAGMLQELKRNMPAFEFVCGWRWDDLVTTDDRTVRFCEGCRVQVHYCETIEIAQMHAQMRHCVAVNLGVRRQPGDLEPEPQILLGVPAFSSHEVELWEQAEEENPDA